MRMAEYTHLRSHDVHNHAACYPGRLLIHQLRGELFVVEADEAVVTVLGTEFNVRAWEETKYLLAMTCSIRSTLFGRSGMQQDFSLVPLPHWQEG